ncbi:MAG TPA: hypothetical protein VFL73_02150 [Solirubrobacteraceae bacterium]|nr:hypothetical protein [Solirubrobacteraceae bacterium]
MADEATTDTVDESTADSATTEATATGATATDGETALGDAGKQALDRMKADRNKYRDDLKALQDQFAALKAQAEGKEAEHTAAVEAQRVKDEALSVANQRILKAEVRAQAAGKLADPKDALRFIDLSEFEVDSDGEVDGDKIAAAITDLVKTKPYLAAQGKRFQGDADGGARNDDRKTQLTRDDLSRMTPEQIAQAKKEGRLNDLLGVK